MNDRRWHPRELLREVFANLAARPYRTTAVLVIVVCVFVAPAVAELASAHSTTRQLEGLSARGYTTVEVAQIRTGQSFPALPCVRFNGQLGVVAAGAIGTPVTTQTASDPGNTFDEVPAYGDITEVLSASPEPGTPGLILAGELASELGVTTGSYLTTGPHATPVAAVDDLAKRDPLLGRLVLDPQTATPATAIQACFVQFHSAAAVQGIQTLQAAYAAYPALTFSFLVPHSANTTSPASAWANRQSRYAWIAAGLVVAVVLVILLARRRHELGVYQITGTPVVQTALLAVGETLTITWAAALSAAVWAAVAAVYNGDTFNAYHIALNATARAALLAAMIPPIGLTPLLRKNLTKALRERTS